MSSYHVRFASTAADREAAFALRRAVFDVEQNVPRPLDRDAHDVDADHVVAFDATGRCVATGRIVRLDHRTCRIGRQATARESRGQGIGAQVLELLEHMADLRGLSDIVVHAQLAAEPFYRKRGYERVGEPFSEQGVEHVRMQKVLLR